MTGFWEHAPAGINPYDDCTTGAAFVTMSIMTGRMFLPSDFLEAATLLLPEHHPHVAGQAKEAQIPMLVQALSDGLITPYLGDEEIDRDRAIYLLLENLPEWEDMMYQWTPKGVDYIDNTNSL